MGTVTSCVSLKLNDELPSVVPSSSLSSPSVSTPVFSFKSRMSIWRIKHKKNVKNAGKKKKISPSEVIRVPSRARTNASTSLYSRGAGGYRRPGRDGRLPSTVPSAVRPACASGASCSPGTGNTWRISTWSSWPVCRRCWTGTTETVACPRWRKVWWPTCRAASAEWRYRNLATRQQNYQ